MIQYVMYRRLQTEHKSELGSLESITLYDRRELVLFFENGHVEVSPNIRSSYEYDHEILDSPIFEANVDVYRLKDVLVSDGMFSHTPEDPECVVIIEVNLEKPDNGLWYERMRVNFHNTKSAINGDKIKFKVVYEIY